MFRAEKISFDLVEIPRLPTGLRKRALVSNSHFQLVVYIPMRAVTH